MLTPNMLSTAHDYSIQRRYTSEDQEVFDSVEWELRDAKIKGENVVFEQKGVEFPKSWSQNATNIVSDKYLRVRPGEGKETSVRQMIDRVISWYTKVASKQKYFSTFYERDSFKEELKYLLLHQKMAFNSPVWFNVGIKEKPRVSACFILDVKDDMQSILNWYVEEGLVFKQGSGAGTNLSRIRSSGESLSLGGKASGPVSFMRGADASAGAIKSGGSTRRSAKLIALNVDHPDIEEFIQCKVHEEKKARVLRAAGFDMNLGGKDSYSLQYQNANNSVGLTDKFLNAYVNDENWDLISVTEPRTVMKTVKARDLMHQIAEAAWDCADPGVFYLDTMNAWHTSPAMGYIDATNPCGEFVRPPNTSCNLASLRLTKFYDPETREFHVEDFMHAVDVTITAMDASVSAADYPTQAIEDTVNQYRELGIGVTDLGALLMQMGLPYGSDEGRAVASAVTALLTGAAYRRSAILAEKVGPYPGWYANTALHSNSTAHLAVINKHMDALDSIDEKLLEKHNLEHLLFYARSAWEDAKRLGVAFGFRNAQVSLQAPTGCLVADSMVLTSNGLQRIENLGNPSGDKWQNVDFSVATDSGTKKATKFFVNGLSEVVRIRTSRGYEITGTPKHRVKVVNADGELEWKKFTQITSSDRVPLFLGGMFGEPREIELPDLEAPYHKNTDIVITAPKFLSKDLAELVGAFHANGSLHKGGLRFHAHEADIELIDRVKELLRLLFNIDAVTLHDNVKSKGVAIYANSRRLRRWWEKCDFSKKQLTSRKDKYYVASVPNNVLSSNNREIYAAYLRGLFSCDGSAGSGIVRLTNKYRKFISEIQTMLLALGIVTRQDKGIGGLSKKPVYRLSAASISYNAIWKDTIGFIQNRKQNSLVTECQYDRYDHIYLDKDIWDEVCPISHERRKDLIRNLRAKDGGVSRKLAQDLYRETGDERLRYALQFYFDSIKTIDALEETETYDISVPENVTYVANGFVSHNTISFMMDSDTTGIEPDLSLIKIKKMVDGGSMKIVNQSVPIALKALGYSTSEANEICEFVYANNSVKNSPHLKQEHYKVFQCALGDDSIHYLDHIKMLAAIQPFISGSSSKTINMPENTTVEEIKSAYILGWKLGLKNLAIYRDNCKVNQPLNAEKKDKKESKEVKPAPATRKKLPKQRRGTTTSFNIDGCNGYIRTGEFQDGSLGEIFLDVSKQGSTLSGIMDAFAISVSLGLQHGVPLREYVSKFLNQNFTPNGITSDPDFTYAKSLVDYIFKRLAVDYLDKEERDRLHIKTKSEKIAELDSKETAKESKPVVEKEVRKAQDTPLCVNCGVGMRSAGSCFVCEECGLTSGCS